MLRHLQTSLILGVTVLAAPAAAQDDPFTTTSDTEAAPDSGESPQEPSDEETSSEETTAAAVDEPPASEEEASAEPEASAHVSMKAKLGGKADGATPEEEEEAPKKQKWDVGLSGYFRAPMALGISPRPGPHDPEGEPELQVSYGPNRTVDANYFSFAYTRLQEQDWVELYVTAKKKHVQATIGWMGYWFQTVGFRNPDAAWTPGIAYLTIDTDVDLGAIKPNIALSGGAWWPKFGRHEKYDTFTLGQYRQMGEQIKLTIPFSKSFTTTAYQGFGTGRDGTFNILAPPLYQTRVGLNLLHYAHLQFNYKKLFELGLHHNIQVTRDPNLYQQTSEGRSYENAREAGLATIGGEVKLNIPRAGNLWVSPSYVRMKNGWALGEAGVEIVHSLSPEGLAGNYMAWSGSLPDSTGTGTLLNLGFLYENTLSNVLGKPQGGAPELKVSAFGLMVDSHLDLPETSQLTQDRIHQFKWGADAEVNPVKWLGLMIRYDTVNYDLNNGGYIFTAITPRISFYSNYLSGERIYLQYSRYRYGENMTLAGNWPWGVPLVPGSDIIQGGVYTGSKPDMDVVKFQADIVF